MSIVSMTGFGRSEFKTSQGRARIEIKSVNQKYFELSPRLPQELMPFIERIRKQLKGHVKRGKVFLSIQNCNGSLSPGRLVLDESLALEYQRILKRMNKILGSNDRVTTVQIMRLPDVIRRTESSDDIERLWKQMRKGLDKAIKQFKLSRRAEGQVLRRDLAARVVMIKRLVRQIQTFSPKVIRGFRQKAQKRLKSDSSQNNVRERLAQEVGAFARNIDITEEIVRLKSHLDSFGKVLSSGGEIGRKMDFICQEMIRETNTMGAKANDYAISNNVVHIKTELEKIREQAQNIE